MTAVPLPAPAQETIRLTNAVEFVTDWARSNSLWPLVFGTSCCAIEMMATGASDNDWARFGLEVARASPRQADLIILAGTIVEKMGSRLVTLYQQMPEPKYVIAMGACTISGGPFYYDSYSVVKGADRLIPVDVYIPGCPPRPEALLYGIMQLQRLIRDKKLRIALGPRRVNTVPFVDPMAEDAKYWEEQEKKKQEELKEAQEKFKAENPDYKGYQYKRMPVEKFDEVKRAVPARRGLAPEEMFARVKAKFPDVVMHGVSPPSPPNQSTPPIPSAPPGGPEGNAKPGPEYILDLVVSRPDYLGLAEFLKTDPALRLDLLIQLTAVDWKDRFEVVVHLLSVEHGHKVFLRVALPHDEHPEIETLSALFAGANWHEREVWDFFGIKFLGHPDLRRLFLEDDFPGHPLRKDFVDVTRMVKRPY